MPDEPAATPAAPTTKPIDMVGPVVDQFKGLLTPFNAHAAALKTFGDVTARFEAAVTNLEGKNNDEMQRLAKKADAVVATLDQVYALLDMIEQLPDVDHSQRGPLARQAMALIMAAKK